MWVYLIVAALIVIGVVGGLTGGGIFTIVLIPLALIVLAASVLFSLWARAAQGSAGADVNDTHGSERPLPHSPQQQSAPAPSSPEALADARRARQ